MHIHSSILIKAPKKIVWDYLVNFNAYSVWNPYIVNIEGVCAPQQRLKMKMKFSDGSTYRITPVLLEVVAEEKLSWKGRVAIPGLFDAYHSFELEVVDDEVTALHHSETLKGILVPFLKGKMGPLLKQAFSDMNLALAKICTLQSQ